MALGTHGHLALVGQPSCHNSTCTLGLEQPTLTSSQCLRLQAQSGCVGGAGFPRPLSLRLERPSLCGRPGPRPLFR